MDDMVLKRMKRRHLVTDAMAYAERARKARPDVVFGADLIAGFPTEDETMFKNTLDHVAELGVTYYHVFPYSERPGTPAANMPTVAKNIRKERAEELRAEIEAQELRYGGETLKVTSSIGVAVYPDHGKSLAALMQEADEALYLAKDGGRNVVKIEKKR